MVQEPAAADLTDRDVTAIGAAADQARLLYEEIRARDPSVAAARDRWQDERTAAMALVRDAYIAAGVSTERAGRATTVWFLSHPHAGPPQGPRDWLHEADTSRWREPGDPPGGLGQR